MRMAHVPCPMNIGRSLLLRLFGRPRGILGRLGGHIMARVNRHCAAWAVGLLDVRPQDRVLEIGCGPGVGIELLAHSALCVVGVDPSPEMLRQARRRNALAVRDGRVELRQGSAESLPLADASCDRVLAVNSLQVWPDARGGLREVRRVLKPDGRLALAFTVHSGQARTGLSELVADAGFENCRIVEANQAFCLLAMRR
jgi:ubiquinone/menaquinone biosynthesis C-methylase UbiE